MTTGEKLRTSAFVRLQAFVAFVLMCGLVVGMLMISSCGRVAPTYEPGTITVTSTPPGANIIIDAQDTGEITPFSFTELVANRYEVAVTMDGFFVTPVSTTVDLTPAAHVTREFALSNLAPTLLTITSDPPGAAISINGSDTGEVTPATLTDLEAGDHVVALDLAGKYVSPASYTVSVVAHETTDLPSDTFTFRNKKIVMMEGFSSVNCPGCPQMAINVEGLQHTAAYGLDSVLYCKFNMSWPGTDPHNQLNITENEDRRAFYSVISIPQLNIDGEKKLGSGPNNTPDTNDMIPFIDAALLEVPGFLIDITADFTNSDVPVTTTLTAMEDVDLTDHTLYIALVRDLIEYETAPGNQGETEFHWLFFDRVDDLPTLSAMTTGETSVFNETLTRGEWDISTLYVVAFVQNNSTKSILQAGISSTATPPAPAALFLDDKINHRLTAGGNSP